MNASSTSFPDPVENTGELAVTLSAVVLFETTLSKVSAAHAGAATSENRMAKKTRHTRRHLSAPGMPSVHSRIICTHLHLSLPGTG